MASKKAHILEEKERTADIRIDENVTFLQMYLCEPVLKGLQSAGFICPSPIQLKAIPLGRCGLDMVVQAKSGTGKTLVFAVVSLEMVSVASKSTQVLVLAPTREIAVQITQVISAIGSAMPNLKTACFIGGVNVDLDKAKLSCCHIVVGTPGRIMQLVDLGWLKLENVRLLILDEADQLLSGQFQSVIVNLASLLPLNKQVLALSATYTDDIAEVADKLMRTTHHVRLDRESPALLGINQFVRLVLYHHLPAKQQQNKVKELFVILSTVTFNQCLVFTNSQLRAESICNDLQAAGFPTTFLTGAQNQNDRLRALDALCTYKCRILVSTDLSSRGLDSEHVNLVINIDLPYNSATYLHRIGRAGRFGSRGGAITLVAEGEELLNIRAMATQVNMRMFLLNGNCDPTIAMADVQGLQNLEFLEIEKLNKWVKLQSEDLKYKKWDEKKIISNERKKNEGSSSHFSKGNQDINGKKLKGNKKTNNAMSSSRCIKSHQEMTDIAVNNGNVATNDADLHKGELQAEECTKPGDGLQHEPNILPTSSQIFYREHIFQIKKMVSQQLKQIQLQPKSKEFSYSEILAECQGKCDHLSPSDIPLNKTELLGFPLTSFDSHEDGKILQDFFNIKNEEVIRKTLDTDSVWVSSKLKLDEAVQMSLQGICLHAVFCDSEPTVNRDGNNGSDVPNLVKDASHVGSVENQLGDADELKTQAIGIKIKNCPSHLDSKILPDCELPKSKISIDNEISFGPKDSLTEEARLKQKKSKLIRDELLPRSVAGVLASYKTKKINDIPIIKSQPVEPNKTNTDLENGKLVHSSTEGKKKTAKIRKSSDKDSVVYNFINKQATKSEMTANYFYDNATEEPSNCHDQEFSMHENANCCYYSEEQDLYHDHAEKFMSMMNYVRTMGQASALMAENWFKDQQKEVGNGDDYSGRTTYM